MQRAVRTSGPVHVIILPQRVRGENLSQYLRTPETARPARPSAYDCSEAVLQRILEGLRHPCT